MKRVNRQIVDLREVFSNEHYVHPGFRGSTSIKAVLSVSCPELSYDGLAIREEATVSEWWWEIVSGEGARKRQEIGDALRVYCKLETYAMYASNLASSKGSVKRLIIGQGSGGDGEELRSQLASTPGALWPSCTHGSHRKPPKALF
jgi:hypothetical protein